jgi:steroid delta-isomerase-like uncharacterized protein
MKPIAPWLLIVAALLGACRPQPAMPGAAPVGAPVTAEGEEEADPATIALAVAYVEAWNSHDPARIAGFLHEDMAYFDASVGDSQRGRQAALDNVIEVFHRAVPDAAWTIRSEPVATADGIAFEWTISGQNTGDWGATAKATGRALQYDGMTMLRFSDGKIVYQGDYYDAATVNRQLGW